MEIASEVRALLLKIAKEIADEENTTVGHLHLIIANGKLTDFIRQEFDKAVADLREAKQGVEETDDVLPVDGNLQGAEDGQAKDADPETAENGPSVEVANAEEPAAAVAEQVINASEGGEGENIKPAETQTIGEGDVPSPPAAGEEG
jgi:hypothetical protein